MSKKNEYHGSNVHWKQLKNVGIDITDIKTKKKNDRTVFIWTKDGDVLLKHKTARILAKFILENTKEEGLAWDSKWRLNKPWDNSTK